MVSRDELFLFTVEESAYKKLLAGPVFPLCTELSAKRQWVVRGKQGVMRTIDSFLGASKVNCLDTSLLLLSGSGKGRTLGCSDEGSGGKSSSNGAFLHGGRADFLLGGSAQGSSEGLGGHVDLISMDGCWENERKVKGSS